MKKPKSIQEIWLNEQMKLTKNHIKKCNKDIEESGNTIIIEALDYEKSQLDYSLKMQNDIYSQITN